MGHAAPEGQFGDGSAGLGLGGGDGLRGRRFEPRLPRIVATRMEMERQSLAVEIGLDLILDVGFRHHDATEVARSAAAFAAPHAHRDGPPQHCKRQARRPRLRSGRFSIRGGRPAHRFLSVLADGWPPPALLSVANYALTAHAAASRLTGFRSCFGSLKRRPPWWG